MEDLPGVPGQHLLAFGHMFKDTYTNWGTFLPERSKVFGSDSMVSMDE